MKNYSRQREAILSVLRSTDTHPTAKQVYEAVREVIPNISLGTVYRNLSELGESGEILSLSVGDGFEHYDGDKSPHLHLCCRECGKITDVVLEKDFLSEIAEENNFTPETCIYILYGVCSDCSKNKK